MLNLIVAILAAFALTFAIKESVLFDKPRIWLIGLSPWFYHLLNCYLCLSFWCMMPIYLLGHQHWFLNEFILWSLMGAATSFFLSLIADKLSK